MTSILCVEDDENDVFLIRRAFRAIGFCGTFHHCANGQEAIDFLAGRAAAGLPMPELVLTDLKLPGTSGFDLLQWIKDNPECMVVPTVVLSSSDQTVDVKRAYCLGANAYMQKPATLKALQEEMEALLRFWQFCRKPEGSCAGVTDRKRPTAVRAASFLKGNYPQGPKRLAP